MTSSVAVKECVDSMSKIMTTKNELIVLFDALLVHYAKLKEYEEALVTMRTVENCNKLAASQFSGLISDDKVAFILNNLNESSQCTGANILAAEKGRDEVKKMIKVIRGLLKDNFRVNV